MEKQDLEKCRNYRAILDDLKKQYDDKKFANYEIKENEEGYSLEKADITYIFEGKKTSPYNVRLTFIRQGCKDISFTESEVLWERNNYEGLKTGIGEFFVRIGALL